MSLAKINYLKKLKMDSVEGKNIWNAKVSIKYNFGIAYI